jgi:hypothetical protein
MALQLPFITYGGIGHPRYTATAARSRVSSSTEYWFVWRAKE